MFTIGHASYHSILLSGLRMNENEALKYYIPYKRKCNNLKYEMSKDGFVEHVKSNKEFYTHNYYIWDNTLESGEAIPIKPIMPLPLCGYYQMNMFYPKNMFPNYTRKIITKNGKLMKNLKRRYNKQWNFLK